MPAQAGIQVFFGLAAPLKMDAGLRRHDKSCRRLPCATSKGREALIIHPGRLLGLSRRVDFNFFGAGDGTLFY
jgi:hypothetical protein